MVYGFEFPALWCHDILFHLMSRYLLLCLLLFQVVGPWWVLLSFTGKVASGWPAPAACRLFLDTYVQSASNINSGIHYEKGGTPVRGSVFWSGTAKTAISSQCRAYRVNWSQVSNKTALIYLLKTTKTTNMHSWKKNHDYQQQVILENVTCQSGNQKTLLKLGEKN